MVNYGKGKIYKIVNDVNDDIYIGSTCKTLAGRMGQHRAAVKKEPNRALYKLMSELGNEHFRIILIENYATDSKDKLTAREQFYIEQLRPSLNHMAAFVGLPKIEYDKIYRAAHKDHKAEIDKKYREAHIKGVKYVCECGTECSIEGKSRHLYTRKHLAFIAAE